MDHPRQTTFYFHGMPGSPAELTLFSNTAPSNWVACDRAQLPAGLEAEERFDHLAKMVRNRTNGEPARIVAFSLGTYVALEVASRLPGIPLKLDLVSPAAPLQLGAFLEEMAGRTIFSLAAHRPLIFKTVTHAQSLAARWAPERLTTALFASAKGADIELRSNATFRASIAEALRSCLKDGADNYSVEVGAYVRDWSATLTRVPHPVTLWQGDADNWTPPAMAQSLARKLHNIEACNILPGLSHYSTLREALSRLA